MSSGTITSTGLGSGIDIEALVTKLMSIEQQPITLIQQQESSIQTKISAYGTLQSTLSSLKDAADAIGTTDNLAAYTASVADGSSATVSVSTGAAAGTHSFNVTQLAQTQKVLSGGYASSSATVPTGTLSIQLGTYNGTTFTADSSRSFSITIDSSNNTLAGVAGAINSAKTGVTATVVNDGSQSHLVLTSDNTGTANSFQLSGISGLDFNPAASGSSSLSSVQTAKDAKFTLDGLSMTRSNNTVTDAIDGLTINLKSVSTSATTIAVTQDTSAIQTKINNFVTAYNNAVGLMSSQTSYDATSKTGGPLNGETTVRSIQMQLRNIIGSSIGSGTISRLSDIGIQIGVDGKLTADSTKLSAALSDPNKDVASLFVKGSSTDGIASQISEQITTMLDTGGLITARTDGLNKNITQMDNQISSLQDRMSTIEARYRQQFNNMDTLIAGLNSTSSYLTQQLASLKSG